MLMKTEDGYISTVELAAFIAGARPGDEVIAKAVPAILDTLGVAIAGSVEPSTRALAGTLDAAADPGAVLLPWERRALRPEDAALLFGTASHVLDFDDVCMLAVCHPSAPVLSALFAWCALAKPSGRELCEAYVVGTEVMIRLGMAMSFRHYALGFHSTGTLGTVGAAAACARLMRLDEHGIASAIAIAASSAGGIRKNFGSPVKSLHVGLAAVNGLRAARLAAAGFGGASEPLDDDGFISAFTGGETRGWPRSVKLGTPFAIEHPGLEQKGYPCCYMLHRMIAGALAVREQRGLTLEAVKTVEVDMPAGGTKPLIHPRPKSGLNALFSAPYVVAAALADGRVDLASFTDEQVLRPAIQSRLADVEIIEREGVALAGSDLGNAPVTLTFVLTSGERFNHTIIHNPGSPDAPLSLSQMEAKWQGCLHRAAASIGMNTSRRLFEDGMKGLSGSTGMSTWLNQLRNEILDSRNEHDHGIRDAADHSAA